MNARLQGIAIGILLGCALELNRVDAANKQIDLS